MLGNSAFLNFNELPILRKDDMTLVDPNAKAAAMRGVKGSDKYGLRRQKAAVASGEDVMTPMKMTNDAADDDSVSGLFHGFLGGRRREGAMLTQRVVGWRLVMLGIYHVNDLST